MKRTAVFGLVMACLAIGLLTQTGAQSQIENAENDKQSIVVHLSHYTDDLHRPFMALKMARLLQNNECDVTLFLDIEGVRLADERQSLAIRWGGDPTELSEYYQQFVGAGGQVMLCPHCAEEAGIENLNLREPAKIASEGEMARLMVEADKVIDY